MSLMCTSLCFHHMCIHTHIHVHIHVHAHAHIQITESHKVSSPNIPPICLVETDRGNVYTVHSNVNSHTYTCTCRARHESKVLHY